MKQKIQKKVLMLKNSAVNKKKLVLFKDFSKKEKKILYFLKINGFISSYFYKEKRRTLIYLKYDKFQNPVISTLHFLPKN